MQPETPEQQQANYEQLQRIISKINADEWAVRQNEIMDSVIERLTEMLNKPQPRDEKAFKDHWRRVIATEVLNGLIKGSRAEDDDLEVIIDNRTTIAVLYADSLLQKLEKPKS